MTLSCAYLEFNQLTSSLQDWWNKLQIYTRWGIPKKKLIPGWKPQGSYGCFESNTVEWKKKTFECGWPPTSTPGFVLLQKKKRSPCKKWSLSSRYLCDALGVQGSTIWAETWQGESPQKVCVSRWSALASSESTEY